jgi:predicted esterase
MEDDMSRPTDPVPSPRRRRLEAVLVATLVLALVASPGAPPLHAADEAAAAAIDDQDLIFLSLMFSNQVKAYLAKPDASERVRAIADQMRGFRATPGKDTVERFRTLAEGYNILTWGSWDEGRQIATTLDLRLAAKLYEPGGQVKARIQSLWDRPERFSTHYLATLTLQGPDGKQIGTPSNAHFSQTPALGQTKEIALALPADAAPGRYRVRYTLQAHHHDGAPSPAVLEAERTFFVVPDLETRLTKLETSIGSVAAPASESAKLALSTVRWYVDVYRQGQREDVPGAYSDHPLFMVAGLTATGFAGERMEFDRELALAETLAQKLAASGDPLAGLDGDLRLAYASPADGQRIPFRIFVPSGLDLGKPSPLVVALHGAGGDENAFMERYRGLYKKEAQARGYLAVAVNGRGPYTGYRGAAETDVLDVTDLVQRVWRVDTDRVYLMGHSMGGMGTVLIGFDHAERFAALAPIAGFGQASQLAKAPRMPLFLGQGDRDALVPVEGARAFEQAAKTDGRDVVYVEKAGTDHLLIVEQVMKDVFDFFDAHRRKS